MDSLTYTSLSRGGQETIVHVIPTIATTDDEFIDDADDDTNARVIDDSESKDFVSDNDH